MKVFSSDNWVEPADAEYKNLCIENFDLDDDENSGNLMFNYTHINITSFWKDALKYWLMMGGYQGEGGATDFLMKKNHGRRLTKDVKIR